MLNNKQIAAKFDLLAKLMELHDENPFKIKSYSNAFASLRKLEGDLTKMDDSALSAIPGIGSSIIEKIKEILTIGDMAVLKKYQDITPDGVQDMLRVKGLGPKKVKQIWKEMEIETVGELLYACQENRLVAFKGFGEKLQTEIKDKLEYFISAQGKFLHAHLLKPAISLLEEIKKKFPDAISEITGDLRRNMPEVNAIEIITTISSDTIMDQLLDLVIDGESEKLVFHHWPVKFYFVEKEDFYTEWYSLSGGDAFLAKYPTLENVKSEEEIFSYHKLPFIPAECREHIIVEYGLEHSLDALITVSDIRGIVHNHSTYSDGLHTLTQMSDYVLQNGFEYFVISDHSKSAGYANGLQIERVDSQWQEIDQLNARYNGRFKVYKGIESDILSDGSLDYDDEILAGFDVVIVSVHSVLNMDIDKATARLIKAIEHPATRILGHPTGRLLLSRAGYPIDHKKVIDACAANNVVIELNANPQRLDIDWTWIPYCMSKCVMISINPDAHSMESIHFIQHGVDAARKGGLHKSSCLNSISKKDFETWVLAK
jgi:DNA polymerase (family X)